MNKYYKKCSASKYWIFPTFFALLFASACSVNANDPQNISNFEAFQQANITANYAISELVTNADLISINPDSKFNVYTELTDYSQHPEYSHNSQAYFEIKLATAWMRGATGAGVTIAVVDTGIRDYSEFAGRDPTLISPLYYNGEALEFVNTYSVPTGEHGSVVAHVAAANFYGIHKDANSLGLDSSTLAQLKQYGSTGVAFEANVIDVPALYYQYVDNYQNNIADQLIANGLFEATRLASYVNMSFGIPNNKVDHNDIKDSYLVRRDNEDLFEVMLQRNRKQSDKSVFVIAAGNDQFDNPSLSFAGYSKFRS